MKDRVDGLVSIIVPVYCAAAYVAETIGMVRAQSYENWELLLIDDCSGDESVMKIKQTLSACERHSIQELPESVGSIEEYRCGDGQSIFLICKDRNEGAAKARNTGLSLAKGRYIAFLDADDVWSLDKLARQLSFMKKKGRVLRFPPMNLEMKRPNPRERWCMCRTG